MENTLLTQFGALGKMCSTKKHNMRSLLIRTLAIKKKIANEPNPNVTNYPIYETAVEIK